MAKGNHSGAAEEEYQRSLDREVQLMEEEDLLQTGGQVHAGPLGGRGDLHQWEFLLLQEIQSLNKGFKFHVNLFPFE